MVELVGREPLVIARVENGVTKIFAAKTENAKIIKKKWTRKTVFSAGNFLFFGRGKTNFWGGV